MLSGDRGGRQLLDVRGGLRDSAPHFVPFVMLGPDLEPPCAPRVPAPLEPPRVPGPLEGKPPRNVGSRRIFPALFKLQVLDAYRHDHDCKGNQRATARKFNIHRRQIQKWLQCEGALRASVADALRYDAGQDVGRDISREGPRLEPRLPEPASRVFKHDARTLKLVAQKLYPSSFSGAVLNDDRKGEVTKTAPGCFVPKEYQLNDTRSEAIGARPAEARVPFCKLNMDAASRSLILKDNVSGRELCSSRSESKSPVQKYCPPCPPCPPQESRRPEPRGLENATSPLPARVAEIVANSKTSAFSPKRKWLQDSLQEKLTPPQPEPLALLVPHRQPPEEPRPKRPCPDFSIERLCGSPVTNAWSRWPVKVKTEARSPPRPASPTVFPSSFPPPPAPLVFPPPLLLPHRTIPELVSLHFKPEPCQSSGDTAIKEESLSDEEDEPIDVLTTSPLEDKSFDFSGFPGGKRRSFSVQFKLNVLDAFYNDKDCNKNQRATARKFNINRRQVQKWLSLEESLRGEGCAEPPSGCAGCPQHCVTLQPCDLPPELCRGWVPPTALGPLPLPAPYHCMAWFTPYDMPRIY